MQESVQPNILKGSLYALAGFFCMAIFGVLTKMAYANSSALWVSFITYFFGTICLVPYVAVKGLSFLKSEHYGYLIGRAVFGTMASFLYMLSMHYIPLVNATLLFNTAPIFIPFLAIFWVRAVISKQIWLAVFIGFIGILVIIKPTESIFTHAGNFIGLASGICLAIAYFIMKLLTGSDPPVRIIFYYLGLGTVLQLPLLFFAGQFPNWDSFLLSVLCGIVMVIAQILLVEGYKFAEASQIGIYQYSSVVFVGIIDWLIWDIVPPLSNLFGVLLVAIAGIIIIRSGNLAPKTHK